MELACTVDVKYVERKDGTEARQDGYFNVSMYDRQSRLVSSRASGLRSSESEPRKLILLQDTVQLTAALPPVCAHGTLVDIFIRGQRFELSWHKILRRSNAFTSNSLHIYGDPFFAIISKMAFRIIS